ncbi:hypothetical protein R7Q39_20495 [Vibrio sp. 947]|uniref:hypothetical protein n=1 Tax=unclassified Vibrio TaxID=2614977 RepID=UPI0029643CF1|nr:MULTISPECIES: hypothetical protein [unclassified Vibrio]MDW1582689.1 hypothetical protein [Vibrio sp. Vb2897]MDW1640950.1 hypothetical protein [Vibrio sp. Vb2896]MDW1927817.1 hypothetical protein [Vibrio sp. 947]
MNNNKYSISIDEKKTVREKIVDGSWKVLPFGMLILASNLKSYINANPGYADLKPFFADWNIPSLIQEAGKGIVSVANSTKNEDPIYFGEHIGYCPIDPTFMDYLSYKMGNFISLTSNPLAVAGILASAASLTMAIGMSIKHIDDENRPLVHYKNKSWEHFQRSFQEGEAEAYKKSVDDLLGGSNGLSISLRKIPRLGKRIKSVFKDLEAHELLSLRFVSEFSGAITGTPNKEQKFMRETLQRITGEGYEDFEAIMQAIKPEVIEECLERGYSFRSVIDMYVEILNKQLESDPTKDKITSNTKAYNEIFDRLSELHNKHIVYHSFANLVAMAYEMQGRVLKGEADKSELDDIVSELEYFESITDKVKYNGEEYSQLQHQAWLVRHDIITLSTENYKDLVGANDSKHKIRASQYADPKFFYERAVKKILPDENISMEHGMLDYLSIATREHFGEHIKKQIDNSADVKIDRDGKIHSDQVIRDRAYQRQDMFIRNSINIAVGMNVVANIAQSATSVKDADYISAPINYGNILTEFFTYIRNPDAVMTNFNNAVNALQSSTYFAPAAFLTVGSLLVVSVGKYLHMKEGKDKYFNMTSSGSWKMVKKYLSEKDIEINRVFNNQMDNNISGIFSRLGKNKVIEAVKKLDAPAITTLAVVAQMYREAKHPDIFDKYIKDIITKDDFTDFMDVSSEILLAEQAKRMSPKKLVSSLIKSLNKVNKELNGDMVIGNKEKFTDDVFKRAEALSNAHTRYKSYAIMVTELHKNRDAIYKAAEETEQDKIHILNLQKENGGFVNKIKIKALEKNIEFKLKSIDFMLKKQAEIAKDFELYAFSKRTFERHDDEYDALQALANEMAICNYKKDYSVIENQMGFKITDNMLRDPELLFRKLVVPYAEKMGLPLKATNTGWDYFGTAVKEQTEPYITHVITQEYKRRVQEEENKGIGDKLKEALSF